MNQHVVTSDGVPWEVQRVRPQFRTEAGAEDVIVEQKDHIGFEALFMIVLTGVLVIASPALWQSDRWWIVLLVIPLAAVTWFMYLAKWQVVLLRKGTVVHRTHVRGRRPAAKVVGEFVAEISRTPDEKLHG